MNEDKERATPEGTEDPKVIETPPQLIITVQPDGNLDIKIDQLTPWHMIGLAEVVKAQAFALMAGVQTGGLVTPPRKGIHLPGGRN